MKTTRLLFLLAGTLLVPFAGSGCVSPLSMGFATPIPVPVWVTERMEEKYCYKNDHRTPVLPPIPPGHRPICEDEPDLASILRAMPHVTRGVPYFYEEFRDDIDYTVEKIADHIDPPRFYPLVGPAQLHHCHWKCTVYYTETIATSYPFPFRCKSRRSEIVYMDRDHLHSVACTPEQLQSLSRDILGPMP
jgi:hypothetical protein